MWRAEDGNERSQKNTYQDNPEEILVEQSHRDSCDINFIMKKYEKTGQVQHVMDRMPNFGDFENIDYQSSLNAVIQAQDTFMSMPAELRKRFENDPGKFLEFTQDPKNVSEMIKLGLATEVPQADATLRDVVDSIKSTKVPKKKPSDTSEG